MNVVTQVVQRTWPRILLKLLNLINLFCIGSFSEFEDQKVQKTKIRCKDFWGRTSVSVSWKIALWKLDTKKGLRMSACRPFTKQTFETKINEDKNKYLIVGTNKRTILFWLQCQNLWKFSMVKEPKMWWFYHWWIWWFPFRLTLLTEISFAVLVFIFISKTSRNTWTMITMKSVLMIKLKHLHFRWGTNISGKRSQTILLLGKLMICWLDC